MGGLAGAAGERRLSGPRWLVGGDAVPVVDGPTVWLVDIDDEATRRRAEALPLAPAEIALFAGRADAGERLLRRRLAKALLAVAGSCHPGAVTIEHGKAGEPLIRAPAGWHISFAARWPLCLIGIAGVPIGVDIETVAEPLPDDVLTHAERASLSAVSPADRTRAGARLWAAKEAHAKWTGEPRRLDPGTIETVPASRHPGLVPGSTVSHDRRPDAHADRWMPGRARHDGEGMLVTSQFGTTRCWHHDAGDHVAVVCTA